jgi:anti-sigma B factor antagonist
MDDVLRIGVVEDAGTTVLKLSGDLDSYTSPRLSEYGKTWLKKTTELLVNLDDLDYIDSTGLSALVAMWVIAKDLGVPMVISCRSARIYRVFELTGLSNLFNVVFTGRNGRSSRTSMKAGSDLLQPDAVGSPEEPVNSPA